MAEEERKELMANISVSLSTVELLAMERCQ